MASVDVIVKSPHLRKFADKVRRRARRLVGKPDNSPWVLEPRPTRRTSYVDFIFALDYLSPNSRLVKMFHEAMGAYGLSVLLVNQSNVESVRKDIESGFIRPAVYLDLSSRPGCPFEKLLYAAHEHGIHAIRNPKHEKWVLKAQAHPELAAAGLPVPPTVILRRGEPGRELSHDERRSIGDRCVIKPSFGEAAKGVVVGIEPTKENITKARDYNREFDWLIQKMVRWTRFGQRVAYLRAYHVCGHRTLLWWNNLEATAGYDLLTWDELEKHNMLPAARLMERMASLTGMDFFSTEIAITEDPEQRLVMIDYCNDQCDMDPDAHPQYSPPVEFAQWVVQRMAEFVWQKKSGNSLAPQSGLFLPDRRT